MSLPCGHPKLADGPCILCLHEEAVKANAPRRDKPKGPGLLRKGLNLLTATAKHVAAGLPEVDETTYRARLAACSTCDLNGGTAEKPKCLHPGCGCNMGVKAKWAEQKCPHPDGSKW